MTAKEPYDLVVAGGGITGAGIARDAALRGLRVALFEKGDFGSGTSSKSSKLIHGGLRYLERGEIGLVFESVSERRVQSRVAPHLVRPLSFLVPIYEGGRVGLGMISLGLWIYDTLALFRSPGFHRTYRKKRALERQPELRSEGLRGAIEYYDCFTDDARLVLENVLDAAASGADCRSYTRVTGVERQDGLVRAVKVRDELTGAEETVPTRTLVLATGPWTDEITRPLGVDFGRRILRPTKGVHLVFPEEKLPLERVVTLISPLDGRVIFAIPWRRRIIIGTTDTDYEGPADDVHADPEDATYLCASANAYFPGANFRPDDIIATWAGLRPLIHEEAETASAVSREHQTYVGEDGVFIIAGGKLTTYRLMAKEVVRAAIDWLRDHKSDIFEGRRLERPRTRRRPLPGAQGLGEPGEKSIERLAGAIASESHLPPAIAEHLVQTYGVRAKKIVRLLEEDPALREPMQMDLPYIWAEVDFAALFDMARTLDDVLARRIPLLLVGRDQGLDVAEAACARLARRLGWSPERRAEELARYRTSVENSRRFRAA